MTKTLGIVGAGKLGTAIGRLALEAGYPLLVTEREDEPMLELIVSSVLPGAQLVDFNTLAENADVVILAAPQPALPSLELERVRGIIIDATNSWEATDGAATTARATTDVLIEANPKARIIKTLNHRSYADLTADARPNGAGGRLAMGVAGSSTDDVVTVARIVDDLGYDPIPMSVDEGRLLEPGGPVFGRKLVPGDFARAIGVPDRQHLAA